MASSHIPGPMCLERAVVIDDGTMCRSISPVPGPVCFAPGSYDTSIDSPLRKALRSFESETINFAIRFIKDDGVRNGYIAEIKTMSGQILEAVKRGEVKAEDGYAFANRMRNRIMDLGRLKLSDLGRAFSSAQKADGLTLEVLQEKYAQRLFKKAFAKLTEVERDNVFLTIIESAGRDNPKVTVWSARFAKLGRGFILLTGGFAVYNVATADNKGEAVAREGVGLGAGIAGGALGGAASGLLCGPGAPVCVTVGVFVGGALGALGMDYLFDWVKDSGNSAPNTVKTVSGL